jgi:hypothetical protein
MQLLQKTYTPAEYLELEEMSKLTKNGGYRKIIPRQKGLLSWDLSICV